MNFQQTVSFQPGRIWKKWKGKKMILTTSKIYIWNAWTSQSRTLNRYIDTYETNKSLLISQFFFSDINHSKKKISAILRNLFFHWLKLHHSICEKFRIHNPPSDNFNVNATWSFSALFRVIYFCHYGKKWLFNSKKRHQPKLESVLT